MRQWARHLALRTMRAEQLAGSAASPLFVFQQHLTQNTNDHIMRHRGTPHLEGTAANGGGAGGRGTVGELDYGGEPQGGEGTACQVEEGAEADPQSAGAGNHGLEAAGHWDVGPGATPGAGGAHQ